MADDSEIDLLKRRKLLEMRRRLLLERAEARKEEAQEKQAPGEEKEKLEPKAILKKRFVGRAWEVWSAAEAQYPAVTEQMVGALASLIEAGRLAGPITGEQLYAFFRRLGLRVRLETKIRIYESGELKTIADKMKGT
jgi:DNA-binding TFAR19-related protein (PDSD5 family)